ncbi:MAG: glycoside hydrolase family 38 N-terminal domain-containing protein [Thermoguttaceae bacterium]
MRKLFAVAALLAAMLPPAFVAAEQIWSLGVDDHKHAEFALSGDYASFPTRFAEDPTVEVGKPDAAADWPWIHPGNRDAWAGSRPHTLTILFDLPTGGQAPVYELVLDTIAAHYGSPPVLKIDLNGAVRHVATRATCRSDRVLENPAEGEQAVYRQVFLAADLKPKGNRLAITSAEGSWLLYDRVSFETRSDQIDRIQVAVERGVLRGEEGGLCRQLTVGYGGGVLLEEAELSADAGGGRVTRRLDPKACLLEATILVPVSEAETAGEATVTLACGAKTLTRAVAIPPERRWEVHLVHQTHLDIGYTHTQEDVLARQVQCLKDSLQYIDQTRDYPEESRFKFHPEGMWAVDEFMRTASDEEKEALVRAAQTREIHLDAMYAQAMTGMYNDEELFELMAGAARFGKAHGVVIDSAMQTDVPGYTWGLVPALAQNGVRYMTMGPNNGHRVGRVYEWADKPFWWESPSGKERVLCWLSGFGYALWHGRPQGDRLEAGRMFQVLDQLAARGFPYDLVMLRYNIEGDNGRPNRALSDSVKEWNEKYAWPKMVISRNSQVMAELERRHGKELPVVRGDYTPYWEDGAASTSEATSLCRVGCERMVQAQALFAMLRPGAFPAAAFDAAWTDLIMYDEHTWGAHCSISQPDDPFTIHQDEFKQAYARRGHDAAQSLVAQAVGKAAADESAADRPPADRPPAIDVYNTASWARGGIVTLAAPAGAAEFSLRDAQGRSVPVQRLADGRVALRSPAVPAFGAARLSLGAQAAQATGSARADAAAWTIGNDLVQLKIDPESGAIASLLRTGIDAELVKPGDDGNRGLNDYLYILGRNSQENRARQSGGAVAAVVDDGPLVATLRIESPAPDCSTLVRQITVVDGSDEILLENRLDKLMERRPEGTFFAFPFNVPGGQWRIDVPWAVVRPELDQLPGANRNYYCVERWCDLSSDRFGVTWVTLDANMMQFAPILYTPPWGLEPWRSQIEPGGTLYSWVCNNHWETNYKAGQEGPLRFRYVLRPHAGPWDQAEAQRMARGVHQPLLAFAGDGNSPVSQPALSLDNDAVVATCLKPARDGHGLVLRLFNTTDTRQNVAVRHADAAGEVWLSNPLEEKLARAPARLELEKYEIVTLFLPQR